MACVRLEITDFADLLREAVNRKQPVFADKFSYGKGILSISLEVTAHRLQTVQSAGSITIVCELRTKEKLISVEAQIPQLYLQIPCTVVGGWFFVKDGTRTLEIYVDGGATGDVRFADAGNGRPQLDSVSIDLRGFQVRFHVFPAWVEKRLQRPIEIAIEDALEKLICHAVPLALADDLVPADVVASQRKALAATGFVPNRRPGLLSRFAYTAAYYLAFGVTYPALLIAKSAPTECAAMQGLRDGAAAAQQDVRRLNSRWSPEVVGNRAVARESSPLLAPALEPS